MKKMFFGLAMLLASSVASAAGYQDVQTPQAPRTDNGTIEVEAVFWYGCPFCYQLEPDVKQMQVDLPDDVELIKVPAPLSPAWATHARVFHVAKALGILDKAHDDIFALLQESHGKGLLDVESMAEFFTKYGVARERTVAMAENPQVIAQMRADFERLRAYGLREVPALIVDGKFIVTSRTAGGIDKMMPQAQVLIEKARKEKQASDLK